MATLLATGWITATPLVAVAAGTISLTAINTAYTQDFNTLASLGTNHALAISGWDILETGGGSRDNELYSAGTGSDTTGDTYSFGSSASGDRAFGGLLSGTLNPTIGASFQNNTGAAVQRLSISYTGEGWRLGADPAAGTPPRGPDRIDFQYSLDATSLANGTWFDANGLDFVSPLAVPAGAKDGDNASNRTAISAAIDGLSIANGASFWIRWSDVNVPSSDDGLAVDDFSLTPMPGNDAAPSVTAVTPANGRENVAINANIDITFSESVVVTDPWFDISCDASGAHTAAVSGSGDSRTLDPDTDFTDLEHCTVTVDKDGVADTDATDPPDSMAADFAFSFQVGPECDDTVTPIHDIQGAGTAAAVTGLVATEGIVVGDFEGPLVGGLQGFHIQDPEADADPLTSEGIFVWTGDANNGVSVGDQVRISSAYARERFNQTTLNGSDADDSPVASSRIFVCSTGNTVPPAAAVAMPFSSSTYLERFEGMRVTFPQQLVIAEYFNYDRFNELVIALPLAGEARPFTPTAVAEPGAAAVARALANSLRRITLDDGRGGTNNPSSLRHPNGNPFSLANRFRGGDRVANATGVLGFDFGLYRIQPTGPADYTPVNARPAAPEDVGGSIKVAAMNTLNFFLTIDATNSDSGGGPCGGNANLDCRGADDDVPDDATVGDEFTRQRTKLLQALNGIDADVLGLNELENTPGVDPVANIVRGLNTLTAPGTYNRINTGVIGTDAIRVGIVYKPGVVTPAGPFKILNSSVDPRFLDNRSRPALAQTFFVNETGARFTVVVNHLKSKGESGLAPTQGPAGVCNDENAGNDVPDCDQGDGQGFWNPVRTAAAEALVDWLATDPTGSGDPDFLIMGDLNAYAMEDPIDAIKLGSDDEADTDDDFTNLIADYQGTYAYSYTFDGQAGYLDHALANGPLADQVTGAADWHINSDEPDVLDYDVTFKPAAQELLYEPNQYRTSDHDPVMVGMDLINAAPTFEAVVAASCSNGAGGTYSVTVDDYDLLEAELTLALTANTNTTLVPNANAVVSGAGASRSIVITAANNQKGTAALTFTLSDGWNEVELVITVKVGNGDDVLVGTSGEDILVGLAGDDSLTGLAGADILCGGKGEDSLSGGDGNDLLEAGIGDDDLRGGAGVDVLKAGGGDDTMTGGAGADSFSGGGGSDVNSDFNAGEGDTSDGT